MRVQPDLLGRRRKVVAARGRHVLDKGMDRHLQLLRQALDAARNQRGLRGRAAGRIDHQRHRHGLTLSKRTLQHRSQSRVIQQPRSGSRSDHTIQADNRDKRVGFQEGDPAFHALHVEAPRVGNKMSTQIECRCCGKTALLPQNTGVEPGIQLAAADFKMHAVFSTESGTPDPARLVEEIRKDGQAKLRFAIGKIIEVPVDVQIDRQAVTVG